MKPETISGYNDTQTGDDRAVCDALRTIIDENLAGAESRVWHGHPVWFLDGNPIVGYAKRKLGVQLMFWSGQSFETPGLTPEGTFKAAEARFTAPDQIDPSLLKRWLEESRTIQWDYKNIVKRKGHLERLS